MPQVFKVGGYIVYFWSNEGEPIEPIHVHVAEGRPRPDGTKIWITESGKALVLDWKEEGYRIKGTEEHLENDRGK